jgi:Ribbon-helix-helix protein, copG family
LLFFAATNIMPRPKGSRKNARLTVTLDDRDYIALQVLSEKEDVSIAWLARRAIQEMLERYKSGMQDELPLTHAPGKISRTR